MPSDEEVISTLNGLIETCRDGQEGFQEAAENVVRSDIKQLFTEAAMQRARFLGELQAEVRALGGDPAEAGSVSGALHRAWIDIKGTFSERDEKTILAECERGEDSALANYRAALGADLPASVRSLVERQFGEVKEAHERVRSLERASGAGA